MPVPENHVSGTDPAVDPERLSMALREAARRDDHEAARAVCEVLLELGGWREVWAHGARLLERAEQARAAHSEVLGRASAQLFGPVLAPCSGAWLAGARVPNPLPRYVQALRIWSPGGWFDWLARRCQLAVVEPPPRAPRPLWLEALETLTPVVTELLGRAGVKLDVRVQVTHADSPDTVRALHWPDGVTVVLADGRCQCGERCPWLPEVD